MLGAIAVGSSAWARVYQPRSQIGCCTRPIQPLIRATTKRGDSTGLSSLGWDQRGYALVKDDRDTAVLSLTLRLSRLISSADYDPVGRCVRVVFCLSGDAWPPFCTPRFLFLRRACRLLVWADR